MSYLICTQYTDTYDCISPVSKDLLACTYFSPDLIKELLVASQEARVGELHLLLAFTLEAAGIDADNLK